MQLAIILGSVYIIVMPILLRLTAYAHRKVFIDQKMQKLKGNRMALKNLPKPLWPKWSERLAFTMKDKRDFSIGKQKKAKDGEPQSSKMQNRQLFFGGWFAGLAVVLIGAFISNWSMVGIGYFVFFFVIGWGIHSSDSLIKTRKGVYDRMFSIAKLKLNQSAEYESAPQAVVKVLEWTDYIKPQQVEFSVPDSFGAEGESGFMTQFNQIFGTETTWVPLYDEEKEARGWDYENAKLTIYAVPPLPQMAPWDAHYVLAPGIAWSFFPIALGVENGIEIENPKSGETEFLLGFDLSGEQASIGKKAGLTVSPTITTSPMCLTGNTRLLLSDGSTKSFEKIIEEGLKPLVPSVDSNKNIVNKEITEIMLTKKNAEIVRVSLIGGSHVDCTPDHPFLTEDGFYVEAEKLLEGQKLHSINEDILEVLSVTPNGRSDVYNAEVSETSNFIIASHDGDKEIYVVAHNCFIGGGTGGGKSLSSDTLVEVIG